MAHTFNNGLGMIVVVGETHVDSVAGWLEKIGESYFVIGEIRKGTLGVSLIA